MQKAAALDCELLLKMFPPAITASTKWSKQVSKLAGKWKQFLQNQHVVRVELLVSSISSVSSLNSTHSSSCVFTYSAHHCSIIAARNDISLVYVAITFSPQFSSLLETIKKILDILSLELFANNIVHRFSLHLFYSYSKFIVKAMPFKSDNKKNMFSYTFYHE